MTQSLFEIEYKEGGWNQQPTAVINLNINGTDYIMDLITYNENIQAGRTKFVVLKDGIKMVTPTDYKLLKNALKQYETKQVFSP